MFSNCGAARNDAWHRIHERLLLLKGTYHRAPLCTDKRNFRNRNLYRTHANLDKNAKPWTTVEKTKKTKVKAVPEVAPIVPEATLHAIMNHRSTETFQQFAKEYLDAIKFLKDKENPAVSCQACIEAQDKRAGFKKAPSNWYALLDAVSSDTIGPISTADICGNRYLQQIVDGATGWTAREPMSKKSGASEVIHKTLVRLQLSCNKIVKRVHTDGAQEQYNSGLKKFLDDQRMVKSTTAQNSSSSNAMVEHRMD